MKSLVGKVIGIIVGVVVLGKVVVAMWPTFIGTDTEVQAISDNSSAAVLMFKTFWPLGLLVLGLGIAVAVIMIALKQFGILGGNSSRF